MSSEVVSKARLIEQLSELGIKPDGVLLVHMAFSQVKPVDDGPLGLISALQTALGPDGTLVMPSMSYDDEHVFDPTSTPCIEEMGVVADTFWRQPSVRRSQGPHAFAASGSHAADIVAPHPYDVPHGLDSSVGRVYEMDGQVLLLGVGHDSNTTIHLAESMAPVRYRRPKHVTILQDGKPTVAHYEEIDHCCANFSFVDGWLDERGLQRRGIVGHAEARLARSRDIVQVVTEHLRVDDTMFLHPQGTCEECDDARASLTR